MDQLWISFLDEMSKHANVVSDEEAEKALDRLDTLRKSAPDGKTVARYAGIGAVSGPAIVAAREAISGDSLMGGGSKGKMLRKALGHAAAGALTSGAIPLVRSHLDRKAEMSKLKTWVDQHGVSNGG